MTNTSRAARVTITKAVVLNANDNPLYIDADAFNPKQHGDFQLCCAGCWDEKQAQVRLRRPSGRYYQTMHATYVDQDAGSELTSANRIFIPPRYSLMPGQTHECAAGIAMANRPDSGALRVRASDIGPPDNLIFNMNINAGQQVVRPKSAARSLSAPAVQTQRDAGTPKRRISVKRSQGISDIEGLAKLIGDYCLDPVSYGQAPIRVGREITPLSEFYKNNPADLMRRLRDAAKAQDNNPALGLGPQACATVFKPQMLKSKFWKRAGPARNAPLLHVLGQPKKMVGLDNSTLYYPQVRLHFDTGRAADYFEHLVIKAKADGQKGSPSLLVYSERAYVNLDEFAACVQNIRENPKADHGLFTDVHVSEKDQMMLWAEPERQGSFNL